MILSIIELILKKYYPDYRLVKRSKRWKYYKEYNERKKINNG